MKAFPYIILGLGVALVAASIVVWFYDIATLIREETKVDNSNSGSSELWWNSNSDNNGNNIKTINFVKAYFFNVTNRNDVISGGKPNLQEIGPYTFEVNITRIIENVDPEKDTISYRDLEVFKFRPDLSNGKETDLVTIINFPFVGLAQEVSKLSSFSKIMVMGVISQYNEGLFLTKTAKQLLVGGYKHQLLATLSSITGEQYVLNNTFGFLYERNNSDYGIYTAGLGSKDVANTGKIVSWNNITEVNFWKSDSCNNFGGSYDGTVFPPGLTKDSVLAYFNPKMCRKIRFGFKQEIEFNGVSGYRFQLMPEEYGDSRIDSENMCYCTDPGENGEKCPKAGAYQLNACAKGASIEISSPHFFNGSTYYLSMANGYHPEESKHASYFDIEPKTGTLLKSVRRVQLSLQVRPLRLFNEFRKVSSRLFPALWVEESRELPPERAAELAPSQLTKLLTLSPYISFSIGILLTLISLGVIILRLRKNRIKYTT